jgi:hypothetical protein
MMEAMEKQLDMGPPAPRPPQPLSALDQAKLKAKGMDKTQLLLFACDTEKALATMQAKLKAAPHVSGYAQRVVLYSELLVFMRSLP